MLGRRLARPHAAPSGNLATLHISPLGDNPEGQWRVFRYLNKGLGVEDVAKILRRNHCEHLTTDYDRDRFGGQVHIEGKRCGYSTSLGVRAQEEFHSAYGIPEAWPSRDRSASDLAFEGRFVLARQLLRREGSFALAD